MKKENKNIMLSLHKEKEKRKEKKFKLLKQNIYNSMKLNNELVDIH